MVPGPEIYETTTTITVPLTGFDTDTIARIVTIINNATGYINFFINSTGSNPTLSGTNTLATTAAVLNVATALQQNKEFFQAEAAAFVSVNYPTFSAISEVTRNFAGRFIDAFIYRY